MLDTQRYFLGSARGQDVSPPSPNPPELVSKRPADDFARGRSDMLAAYGAPGVIEKTGPLLGIAFSEQLVHGWDLAIANGKDATVPDGLAEAAFEMIHGRLIDDQRKAAFNPEVQVPADAPAQERLLAYTGRQPST